MQSQSGEAHRQSMVLVGFDLRAVQRPRIDGQGVAGFDHPGAAPGQFGAQGPNTFAFLEPEPAQLGEGDRARRERGEHRGGENAVA